MLERDMGISPYKVATVRLECERNSPSEVAPAGVGIGQVQGLVE